MSNYIQFDKIEYRNIAMFVCKDSGWQLSKEHGFHKRSSPHNYIVKWIEHDGKWSLFSSIYNGGNKLLFDQCIITLDTMFDVFDYVCKNKYTHY